MACKRSAVRSRLARPYPVPIVSRPRTSPFHGGNRGSNPLGDAIFFAFKFSYFVVVVCLSALGGL